MVDGLRLTERAGLMRAILATEEGRAQLSSEREVDNCTMLHIAARRGLTDTAKEILATNEGRDLLSIKDNEGRAPLDLAYSAGYFNQFVAAFGFVDRMKLYASHPIMTMRSNMKLVCAAVAVCTVAIAYVCVKGLNFSGLPEMLTKSVFASSQQSMGI